MRRGTIRRASRAFTLIELLLVLVILSVLIAIVAPKYLGRAQESKITGTKVQINAIKNAIELFEHDNGRVPSTEEGLQSLVTKPGDMPNWHNYMDTLPLDAWGQPFVYRSPGSNDKAYDIVSFGPDNHEGGGDDITN